MRVGDLIQSSIWVTGDEHPAIRKRYEEDVIEAIDYLCDSEGFIHGEVNFTEKHPMDDTPDVPDHIQGSRVRLLVGETEVTQKFVQTPKGSFVANLDIKDLMKLRAVIRRHRPLSNVECDMIIEQIGPEAALDTLRTH